MGQREFKGELSHIKPGSLISEKTSDMIDNFFLALALVFNDLKGLILFDTLIVEEYRPPGLEEITPHAGEYGGVRIQIYKSMIAIINEFFELIKRSKDILSTTEFNLILKTLSQSAQEHWKTIVDIADGSNIASDNFSKTLCQIRSNVVSHYYQADKNLRKGFCIKFFEKEIGNFNKNERAYYSVGQNLESTRFYYIDAAVEEYLYAIQTKDIPTKEEYKKLVITIVEDMNFIIASLLKEYLRKRRSSS